MHQIIQLALCCAMYAKYVATRYILAVYDMTVHCTDLCPELWKFVFDLSIHLLMSHNMKQKYEQTLQDDCRMKWLKNDKHPCHQLYVHTFQTQKYYCS